MIIADHGFIENPMGMISFSDLASRWLEVR
jgi:hypothetical protein